MIKLSERLRMLFDMIEEEETMADIGTDHGFLPMALLEAGICPRVILSDVHPGPLRKARENMGREGIAIDEEDVRLGNGLETLAPGEVDAVVLAGMGGVLMTRILEEDLEKTLSFRKWVFQPRNGQDKLRRWLHDHGFQIRQERLVRERGKICEILLVRPPVKDAPVFPSAKGTRRTQGLPAFSTEEGLPDICYRIPDPARTPDKELLFQLLFRLIRREEMILGRIRSAGRQAGGQELIRRGEARKAYLEAVLAREKTGDGKGEQDGDDPGTGAGGH